MSLIPRFRTGDCSDSSCGKKNTKCVKVGKNLFCFNCRNKQKKQKQLDKASVRKIATKLYKEQDNLNAERAYLIVDLDDVVSKYVRIKEANSQGIVECYTCSKKDHWTKMDCGHYISRKNYITRWDIRNLRPQCKKCNQLLSGNIAIYEFNLNTETPGITEDLKLESRQLIKYTRQELKSMLIDYREKLKIAKTRLNNE